MEELLQFFQQHGLWLTVIALVGVIVLGILKYCNVFKKLDEKVRHVLYLVISVGISLIGSAIYLACVGGFDITYFITLAGAIFALDQTFYAIYANLGIKELLGKVWEYVKLLIDSKLLHKSTTQITTAEKTDITQQEVEDKAEKSKEEKK